VLARTIYIMYVDVQYLWSREITKCTVEEYTLYVNISGQPHSSGIGGPSNSQFNETTSDI